MRTWMTALLVVVSGCAVSCNGATEVALQQTAVADSVNATLTARAASAPPPDTCPETARPWDTSWLPLDRRTVARRIDEIVEGSGLADQGALIVDLSIEYRINPAFALAMFKKEASFAGGGTRARRNNNPGNIIATGDCRGRPAGQECSGHYGETSTDGRFGVYASMAHGVEAHFRLLASEYKPGTGRDCESIRCIVSAYCPPAECNTDQYVAQISGWSEDYQCELLHGLDAPAVLGPRPAESELAVTVVAVTPSLPATWSAGTTTLVSRASDGTHGNDRSWSPSISADGRYVAFQSEASNLVSNATDGSFQVFVHDRQTGETAIVSVASDGTHGDRDSTSPSISADGRYVAFRSRASNLLALNLRFPELILVHDRQTGQTDLVSVAPNGTKPLRRCFAPSISADGRYVVFASHDHRLNPSETCGNGQVLVHDRDTGQTTIVSTSSNGIRGNVLSSAPSISADGRYVAFDSYADNLVSGDTNGHQDVFVHDRETGQTERVSVAADGTQGNHASDVPSISANARYVAFLSYATNLVSGDLDPDPAGSARYVLVHDRHTGETTIVAKVDAARGNTRASRPSISADGRYVAFDSYADNLVSGDTNGHQDVFVHDRETGQTERVSVASDGTQGNANSGSPRISADGRHVAFSSWASNLVPDHAGKHDQIFVHDRK